MLELHIGKRKKKVVVIEPLHLQNLEFHGSEKKNVVDEPLRLQNLKLHRGKRKKNVVNERLCL